MIACCSRVCGQLPQSDDGRGDVPGCRIACVGFVVSRVHASKLLDFAEVVFDQMTPFIGGRIVRDMNEAVSLCRNDSLRSKLHQRGAQMVCVERLVGEHRTECQPFDQVRHADDLAALAGQELKADKVAKGVGQRQDLCRQTALRPAYGLILSPPFAPLAFW